MNRRCLLIVLGTLSACAESTRTPAPVAPTEPAAPTEAPPPTGPAPIPLTLIWKSGPSPATTYALCTDTTQKDFCLAETRWWGVCRTAVSGTWVRAWKEGTIDVNPEGAVRFTGCPEYEALIADSVTQRNGFSPDKVVFRSEACVSTGPAVGSWVLGYRVAEVLHLVVIDAAGSAHLGRLAGSKEPAISLCHGADAATAALATAGLPLRLGIDGVGVNTRWLAEPVGDLNGDGTPELIFHTDVTGYQLSEAAILASSSGALDPLAVSVGVPDIALHAPERRAVHDVQNALDACEHWGGEEPYDEERARDIAAGAEQDCAHYKQVLREARTRYPENEALAAMSEEP